MLKYALLPGIFPRAKEFATGGFGYLAFLFATVYRSVRILPDGHPFTRYENIGSFTLLQTMTAAANNIQFNRRNIDQIIVFAALLIALVLMALQFFLLVLSLLSGNAFAGTGGGKPFDSMFVTQYPTNDIALLMLDYTFGIPGAGSEGVAGPGLGFFGSGAIAAGPTPFQLGMHALFKFYNLALLLVAVLIFLYYVVVVVVETAQTGVPFGRRFAKIYAPFRLIIAVGLLVPLNYGFNGAQYITLTAAKIGSAFATNGWILYNRALQNSGTATNPMGVENSSLLAMPKTPSVRQLLEFSSLYHACRDVYGQWMPKHFDTPSEKITIKPYVIVEGKAQEFDGYTYTQAKKDFGTNDMEVVLGELDTQRHKQAAGGVEPYCGKITISLAFNNPRFYSASDTSGGGTGTDSAGDSESGVLRIEKMYYNMTKQMLKTDPGSYTANGGNGGTNGDRKVFPALGERMSRKSLPEPAKDSCYRSDVLNDNQTCANDEKPPLNVFEKPFQTYDSDNALLTRQTYQEFRTSLNPKLTEELERRGWGGAGIWYNNIADLNGAFTGAVYATPTVKAFPMLLEKVKKERQLQDKATDVCNYFNPNLADNRSVSFDAPSEKEAVIAMKETFEYFNCQRTAASPGGTRAGSGGAANQTVETRAMDSNMILQVIQQVFGIEGLFELRASSQMNEETGAPIVHPLAQLSTIGKSLLENAIRSTAYALGASFVGGMLPALGSSMGPALQALSGMFVSIAMIGLTAGFILYYILPFLPFIYFFFAVGAWVKSIFEAMVGTPLWALAHLHIDGDGLSGRAAASGYFLIFEIFLRPIVTLFGLIASIAIFGAGVTVLHTIFDLVVTNVTGVGPGESNASVNVGVIESFRRGTVDKFFFTIMYAIIVYMMATSAFKMIDTIPKNIMRWIGSGVSKFNDATGDPAGGLTQYAAIGASKISSQVLDGAQGGVGAAGAATGGLFGSLRGNGGGGTRR